MKILIVIPARYASVRFPGKPLVDIGGKSMIRRVYEQAKKTAYEAVVAVDDERVKKHVEEFGVAIMTSPGHASGTDRCHEAAKSYPADYIINLQGDEPFIDPSQINLLAGALDGQTAIATLVKKAESAEQYLSPHVVKAVFNQHNEALYFSRSPIPHIRCGEYSKAVGTIYKHIGIYAYRADVLSAIAALPPSSLETTESLEQLRWLQAGYKIKVVETAIETLGIDTPEDLMRIKIP